MINNCSKCSVKVYKGVFCHKCTHEFHYKCVGLPSTLAKGLSNEGIFFFCDDCRKVVLDMHVAPIGDNSIGKKGGIGIVNRLNNVARVQDNVGSSSNLVVDNIGSSSNVEARVEDNADNRNVDVSVDNIADIGSVNVGASTSGIGSQEVGNADSQQVESGTEGSDFIGFAGTGDRSGSTQVDASVEQAGRSTDIGDEGQWTVVNRARRNFGGNVSNVNRIRYGELFVAGDSITRHQGLNMKNRLGRTDIRSVCIPGGKIENIGNAVADTGNFRNIVISVGTNEIGKTGYANIVDKYLNLIEKLRAKNSKVIIVGILPRLRESGTWLSKAIAVNNWLQQQCVLNDFTYVDMWDVMYENRYYYNRDGIHLNFQGRAFFSDFIVGKIRNFLGHPQVRRVR